MIKGGSLLGLLLLAGISSCRASYQGSSYYDGYEFAFYFESVDFETAMVRCQANHQNPGWLAEPKDPSLQFATENAVTEYTHVWIGATDLYTEGEWLWLDGTEMIWHNWHYKMPDNYENEDCLMMRYDTLWNDYPCCSDVGGYVCQRLVETTYKFGHSELEIVRSPGSFWQSEQACAASGGRLVEVADEKSETDLRRIMKYGKEQLWVAGNGDGVSRCLAINNEGTEEYDCSVLMPAFLCEKVGPHALKVSQHKVSTSVGSRVEVECAAEGYPTPDVVWYRDGLEVQPQLKSTGKTRLILESLKTVDAGRYFCYATNDVNSGKFEVKTFMEVVAEE